MKILLYSTSSNIYEGNSIKSRTLPSWKEQWQHLAEKDSENQYIIASQLPGSFLLDVRGNEIKERAEKIQYHLIEADKEKEIAEELALLEPDLALALSFYVMPYDWLTVKDAMVADYLREKGIKTICHSVESAMIFFDKWQSHLFMGKNGISCPKGLYMHHELFINAGNRRDLKSNIFREGLFHQLKKMTFPLIIKDTTGLSSFGADVVNNYDQALGVLKSKKTTSDKIIEEMILGEQFGCEIYGKDGKYTVLPPFKFSVNKYGITSPKQSVKAGPYLEENAEINEKYNLVQLKDMLLNLAKVMNLNGIAQVDLVFREGKWFVIEVNPRLSGMSTSYACSGGFFLSDLIWKTLLTESKNEIRFKFFPTINIKLPLMKEDMLEKLYREKGVRLVNQIENKEARQIREQGYCEVIISGEDKNELLKSLDQIKKNFASENEEGFFIEAKKMTAEI
ncbi:MAG: ATP-grasp domain-containing protein [Treponema sp.]|nr:ATP-grasp domain-containing protein [Treponema sp.]